ncbi:MAG TPA: hypothetical protein VFY48_09590 [Solirubrobacterales bacterium]|nr:hypothetical protein [Solirubrobacterales bacterium]
MGGNDANVNGAEELTWIFETTVLSSFALAGRLDIPQDLYSGRASWTLVVHDELIQGIREEPRLGAAVASDWLGEPQPVFNVARVEDLRLRLGGRPGDSRHLGEATCIALAEGGNFGILLDDRDAKQLAEGLGISTGTTLSILRLAVGEEKISDRDASALVAELIDRNGRRLPRLKPDHFSGT